MSVDIYGVSFGVRNYPEGFSVFWGSPRSIYSRDLKREIHSGCLGGLELGLGDLGLLKLRDRVLVPWTSDVMRKENPTS